MGPVAVLMIAVNAVAMMYKIPLVLKEAMANSTTRISFEQTLANSVTEQIGANVAPLYRTRFESVDGKLVCVIEVERASEPIFLKSDKGQQFRVRR